MCVRAASVPIAVSATAGTVPVTDLGVKAVDDYTLQFTTESPAPYLLAQALYAWEKVYA